MGYTQQRNIFMARMTLWGTRRAFSLETDFEHQARYRYTMLEEMLARPTTEAVLRAWWEQKDLPKAQRTITLETMAQAWRAPNRDAAIAALLTVGQDTDLVPLAAEYVATLGDPTAPGFARSGDYHRRRAVQLWLAGRRRVPASQFTTASVVAWLGNLRVGASTKRVYLSHLRGWVRWLTERGKLTADPTRGVRTPKEPPPRVRYLEQEEIDRVIAAAPPDCRPAFIFMYGTGVERAGLRGLRRRDILDWKNRMVMVRGAVGKSRTRERLVNVEEWAWDLLAPTWETMLPDAKLLPEVSDSRLMDQHARALKACHLNDRGATLHAARHAWAVRQVKEGVPLEAVSRQLGHVNSVMVNRVYGIFVPRGEDWARWNAMKAERAAVYRQRGVR